MKNIISKKFGWYLAKITASIETSNNFVAIDLKSIRFYFLSPGSCVKIKSLNRKNEQNKLIFKFIILPYLPDIKNYQILQNILDSLRNKKFRYINKEYLNEITSLIESYESEKYKNFLNLKELLEFDTEYDDEIKIAMPESWMNENSIDLGETILLRNDVPSPVIT